MITQDNQKQEAIQWLEAKRLELHGEFANHG